MPDCNCAQLRERAEAAEDLLGAVGKQADAFDRLAEHYKDRATSAEARVSELVAVLKEYVDEFGGIHEEDCPEDDTCTCAFVARTNAALRGAR